MWLMKQMAEKRVARYDIADKGTVALSEGGRVNVRASGEHVGVPVAAPYGIAYVPPRARTRCCCLPPAAAYVLAHS